MTRLDPHYVSVEEAADFLALSKWSVYKLLDSQTIESRYQGRKRLVVVTSLREYAEGLPRTPKADAS